MKTMSKEETMEYLRHAVELEVSVFSQQKLINDADRQIIEPQQPYVSKRYVEQPQQPTFLSLKPVPKKPANALLGLGIAALALGMFNLILGLGASRLSQIDDTIGTVFPVILELLFLLFCGCGVILLIIWGTKNKSYESAVRWNADAEKKNYAMQMNYNAQTEEYNRQLQFAETEYQQALVAARHQYDREHHSYLNAKSMIAELEKPLNETKQVLAQLYAMDVVFPKYRDMIAVSTFYEYYLAGRVTELEGSDGAYNLYESELRMNLIVDKLDTVISNLEAIKQYQYGLYKELKKTDDTLNNIASEIRYIAQSTENIEKTSRITAYCAGIAVQNTEALKYLALVR